LLKGKVICSPLTNIKFKGLGETDKADKILKIAICIFLMVATFCIYSQLQDHEFINYDDYQYIKDDWKIKPGLTSESISWAFTTFYGYNWFPITWLSHTLDYQFYGLNPKGHHLTNLFFHIANSLLLFMILIRMTGKLWRCAFIAAMFTFHPLNVESVARTAESKNVLSTLF
jgi:protein O-mannosyl-transferase